MTARNRATWSDVVGALAMTALLILATGIVEAI